MWTDTTRAQYARADLALPIDLTDAEWALLEPFFPPPSHMGRPRKWPLRRIVEAIGHLEEPADFGVSVVALWADAQALSDCRISG